MKLQGRQMGTWDDIRDDDLVLAFPCIFIGQHSRIVELPAKHIGQEENDSFWAAGWRTSNVAVKAVEPLFITCRLSVVDGTLDAVGAGHCCCSIT